MFGKLLQEIDDMKILMINSVCGYGSTGKIVADLARGIEKSGDECWIAYGRGEAPADLHTYRIGDDLGVYMHGVLSRIMDKHGFYSSYATKTFIRWMKQYNPDVIHLHNLHGYYINIELLFQALKELDKPVIWTLHDCWAFTGHCAYFDFCGCDKWKTQCEHCIQKKEYPTSLVVDNSRENYIRKKAAIGQLDKLEVVTPSEWLKQLVEQSFLNRYPVQVVKNGIDLSTFHPIHDMNIKQRYGLQNKKIILGVASEWSKRKGIQDFEKLADMIDDTYHIVLIGTINAKESINKPNVTLINRTENREQLAAWYTEAYVFFNPTYEDNFPTVNLESQACGTPVITYNTGGSPEGIIFGCGCVIEQSDLNALVKRLKQMEEIQSIKIECAEIAKEKMLERYMETYRKQTERLNK